MMPDTNEVLDAHDWHTIACQCDHYHCTRDGGCRNQATHQIEFHALDHCNQNPTPDGETLNPFGNYVLLRCPACYIGLIRAVIDQLRQRPPDGRGHRTCATCQAPAAAVADIIREVTLL